MLSLARSVITQATRGGRCVVPRRNFCSPPVSQEAKGAGGSVLKTVMGQDSLVFGGCFIGGALAYLAWDFVEIFSLLQEEHEVKKKLAESESVQT